MLNKTPLRLVATDERPRPGEDEEATPMTLMSEEAAITRKVPESEMIAARDMLPEKRKRPDWHKLLPAGAVAVVVVVVILALATKGKGMAPPALDTHRGAPVAKPDEALRPHASGSPPTQEGASPSEAEGRPEIIRVEITATPVETELSIDGNVVASHRLNLHVPNDRGIHVLSASAPGYVPFNQQVSFSSDVVLNINLRRGHGPIARQTTRARPSPFEPRPKVEVRAAPVPSAVRIEPGMNLEGPTIRPNAKPIDERNPYKP